MLLRIFSEITIIDKHFQYDKDIVLYKKQNFEQINNNLQTAHGAKLIYIIHSSLNEKQILQLMEKYDNRIFYIILNTENINMDNILNNKAVKSNGILFIITRDSLYTYGLEKLAIYNNENEIASEKHIFNKGNVKSTGDTLSSVYYYSESIYSVNHDKYVEKKENYARRTLHTMETLNGLENTSGFIKNYVVYIKTPINIQMIKSFIDKYSNCEKQQYITLIHCQCEVDAQKFLVTISRVYPNIHIIIYNE